MRDPLDELIDSTAAPATPTAGQRAMLRACLQNRAVRILVPRRSGMTLACRWLESALKDPSFREDPRYREIWEDDDA